MDKFGGIETGLILLTEFAKTATTVSLNSRQEFVLRIVNILFCLVFG